jgi:hypothetical protein
VRIDIENNANQFNASHTKPHINMIDTLKYCKKFQAAGFDEKQAEILVASLAETTEQTIQIYRDEELATKGDIKVIEGHIKVIEENIKRIDRDIAELKVTIEQVRSNLLQWMVTMLFGQTAIIIGAVFAMIKFLN